METHCLPISPIQVVATWQTNLSAGEITRARVGVPPGDKKHLSICVIACRVHLCTIILTTIWCSLMIVFWLKIFKCFAVVKSFASFVNIVIFITWPWLAFVTDTHLYLYLMRICLQNSLCELVGNLILESGFFFNDHDDNDSLMGSLQWLQS